MYQTLYFIFVAQLYSMEAGDVDIIDGELVSNGATSTTMSDGDIQQILRQFNTKYAKSKNAGVSIVTNSFTNSLTHSPLPIHPLIHLLSFQASLFHVGKQSTIAKTGEIIRQLGITTLLTHSLLLTHSPYRYNGYNI